MNQQHFLKWFSIAVLVDSRLRDWREKDRNRDRESKNIVFLFLFVFCVNNKKVRRKTKVRPTRTYLRGMSYIIYVGRGTLLLQHKRRRKQARRKEQQKEGEKIFSSSLSSCSISYFFSFHCCNYSNNSYQLRLYGF